MFLQRNLAIRVCVIAILCSLCYSLAGGIEDALNEVAEEFEKIEDETSNAGKYVLNVVADEFKITEKKALDASNIVVDELHLIEAETSNVVKHAADAVVHEFQQIQLKGYGCLCADDSCGCCAHLDFPKIHLNDTGCVNITYLAKDYGISFTITIDNLTIYNETISARDPPPICFDVPYLEKYAELCVRFYDLDATKTKLHGCVDVEARLYKILVGHYKLGCFNIGKSTVGLWKKYHRLLIEKLRSEQKKLSENLP